MEDTPDEMRVAPRIRAASVTLCIFGSLSFISSLYELRFFNAATIMMMLVFVLPIAATGRLPKWLFGMSQDEIKSMYKGPFRLPSDGTGIMTVVFIATMLALLFVGEIYL